MLYVKEVQDLGLFAAMSNSRLFLAFANSPLYYVVLPFLGILLPGLAVINGYELAVTNNKNVDAWTNFIISSICGVLASVSLFGAVIAAGTGGSFAAGPWFFFASLSLAFTHQSIMLAITLHRLYESTDDSAQHSHYLQAAINNGFVLGLLASVIGAVYFVMINPVAPLVGSAFAISSFFLTAGNMIWRITPTSLKATLKEHLSVDVPQAVPAFKPRNPAAVSRLFTSEDYSKRLEHLDEEPATQYLNQLIDKKNLVLAQNKNEKNDQKFIVLGQVKDAIQAKNPLNKSQLISSYPLAFQSFWMEKGEVERLVDAGIALINKSLNPVPQASPSKS